MGKTQKIIKDIQQLGLEIKQPIKLMEVCGTHTQVISRYGIRQLMPKNVELVTGPGCPVCVTDQVDIDAVVSLARAGVPIATYGDMICVPGFFGSLEDARSKGNGKVFVVYSTEQALNLQKRYPDLVFFGLGFETTAPMTAYAIQKGLTVYSTHKLFVPAMQVLAKSKDIQINGFINPGHVSTIIGIKPYQSIKLPQVITGFEKEDVLVGIYLLLKQIKEKRATVENEYLRSVKEQGNQSAFKEIFKIFRIGDGRWRGFGIIPKSGLEIKEKYKKFDAKIKYKKILSKIDFSASKKPSKCRCGEIIKGLIYPKDCPLFKKICAPDNPYGPCMVSVEGACNVEYRYN